MEAIKVAKFAQSLLSLLIPPSKVMQYARIEARINTHTTEDAIQKNILWLPFIIYPVLRENNNNDCVYLMQTLVHTVRLTVIVFD